MQPDAIRVYNEVIQKFSGTFSWTVTCGLGKSEADYLVELGRKRRIEQPEIWWASSALDAFELIGQGVHSFGRVAHRGIVKATLAHTAWLTPHPVAITPPPVIRAPYPREVAARAPDKQCLTGFYHSHSNPNHLNAGSHISSGTFSIIGCAVGALETTRQQGVSSDDKQMLHIRRRPPARRSGTDGPFGVVQPPEPMLGRQLPGGCRVLQYRVASIATDANHSASITAAHAYQARRASVLSGAQFVLEELVEQALVEATLQPPRTTHRDDLPAFARMMVSPRCTFSSTLECWLLALWTLKMPVVAFDWHRFMTCAT